MSNPVNHQTFIQTKLPQARDNTVIKTLLIGATIVLLIGAIWWIADSSEKQDFPKGIFDVLEQIV